jgi:hypothetical protein
LHCVASPPTHIASPAKQTVALQVAAWSFSKQYCPAAQCSVGSEVVPLGPHFQTLPSLQNEEVGTQAMSRHSPLSHTCDSEHSCFGTNSEPSSLHTWIFEPSQEATPGLQTCG